MRRARCRRRARRGRTSTLAQALAARMGLTDPVFRMSEPESLRELFTGATGAAAGVRSRPAVRAPARSHIAHHRTASRSRRRRASSSSIPRQLAAQGLPPMPDWQPGSGRGGRGRALAAAPADRAGLFPGAHRVLRRRLPAPARGQAVLRAASRGRRRARPARRRRGAAVQRSRRDRPDAAGERRDAAGRRAGARPAAGRRGGAGTINMLCSDRYTDMGEGATYLPER